MAISVLSVTGYLPTPAGRIDLRYQDGNEPSIPDITIDELDPISLTEGASGSHDFSSDASGTDLTGATYSLDVFSGSLAAIGFSMAGSVLTWTSAVQGSFVGQLRITKDGYPFLSPNNLQIVVSAVPVVDNAAPAEPFGLIATNISTTRNDLVIDWTADTRTATAPATDPPRLVIERSVDGSAFEALTTLTGSSQPNPVFQYGAVGAITNGSGTQAGADFTLTAADGVLSSTQHSMAFMGGLVSGNFEVAGKMPTIVSAEPWSISGLCICDSLDPMAPGVFVARRTETNAVGQPMLIRATHGGALTFTGDANVPAGTPYKIVKTGNVASYRVWSGGQWVTIGSPSVVMVDPVFAGVYLVRSAAGDTVTVTHPQVRINALGAVSHSDTTVSTGHTYGYRAKGRDSASTPNESAYGSTSFATTGAPAVNAIRAHFGHYAMPDGIIRVENWSTLVPRFVSDIQGLANEPTIKGVKVFIQWGVAEQGSTPGNYGSDSTPGTGRWIVKQLRDACAAAGKRLWISWIHVQFGGFSSDYTRYFPAYIVNGSQYGISLMLPGYGIIARVWQQATMDRIIAQVGFFADLYKDDPYVECMQMDETSISVASGTDGFSHAAAAAQYKRFLQQIRAYAPKMGFRLTANFQNSNDIMADLIATAAANDIMVGGPDTLPAEAIQANRIFCGSPNPPGQTQSLPIIDYRSIVPFVAEVQSPTMNGKEGNWTCQQIYDAHMNGYNVTIRYQNVDYIYNCRPTRPQYFIWYMKEWKQPPNADGTGTPPNDGIRWTRDMLPFIRSINGAIGNGVNSTPTAPASVPCPSGYPACAFG